MRPTRVLIVDDNRDAADLTAVLLTVEGHEAEAVYNGGDALLADRRFRPDVVLLDLGLPDMDGSQVARSLSLEDPPPLLIAISGHAEDQVDGRARSSGCSHHLLKPVDIEALLKLVADAPGRDP